MRFPFRAFIVGILFSILFAYLSSMAANRAGSFSLTIPSTQISSLHIFFVLFIALAINPLLGLLRGLNWRWLSPFNVRELILIFILGVVPAGLTAYGFLHQVIPMAGALHLPRFSGSQSNWDEQLVPNLDPDLFIGASLFSSRDIKNFPNLCKRLRDAGASKVPSPAARVWTLLPPDVQATVEDMSHGAMNLPPGDVALMRSVLHSLLGRRSFFLSGGVNKTDFPKSIQKLLKKEKHTLTSAEQVQLYREFYLPVFIKSLPLPPPVSEALRSHMDKLATKYAAAISTKGVLNTDPKVLKALVRESLAAVSAGEVPGLYRLILTQYYAEEIGNFVAGMKNVLRNVEFYHAEDFADLKLPSEVQEMLTLGVNNLDTHKIKRLNRYLLETGLGDALNPSKFLRDQYALIDYERGFRSQGKEAFPVFLKKTDESLLGFAKRANAYRTQDGSPGNDAKFFGEVPWGIWAAPLFSWGLIGVLCILFFYSLNELVFRRWFEQEKITFPIAELTISILDRGEDEKSTIPLIARSPAAWIGFAIAFGFIFYNGMINADWLPGMQKVDFTGNMNAKFQDTIFEGLNYNFRFSIIFVVIGLAFLLPTEVSFSIWLFFAFRMSQQLVMVWMGYGESSSSFPSNWINQPNFGTAQGGGAMFVFGLVAFWKVRRNFVAWIYRLAIPSGSRSFSKEDIVSFTWPSIFFFIGSCGIIWFLRHGGVAWGMTLLTYLSFLLMTITMVRFVAECGLLSFQVWFGPIHIMRIFGLFKWPALFAANGMGTVLLILGALFLDTKTFIAPTMMNARFLAEKNEIKRSHFGLCVAISVLVTLVVSTVTILSLMYDGGITEMNSWFFQGWPRSSFNRIADMTQNAGNLTELDGAHAAWFGVGAFICGALIYLRQMFFWVPHPIGIVLLVSSQMGAHWFSIFIGWVCKRTAIKYCDVDSYKVVRYFFVGLILGHVIAVAVALILKFFVGIEGNLDIDLNRNA